MEEQKTISNAEKRWLVREVEAGRLTIGEAKERLTEISKDPYSLLQNWRKKYASDIELTLPIMTENEKQKVDYTKRGLTKNIEMLTRNVEADLNGIDNFIRRWYELQALTKCF